MDLKEKLQKGYDKVEEAVKNTVDNCKIEVKITEKEREVKTLTKEIGEIVVAELEGGAVMSDAVMEKYAALKEAKMSIEILEGDKKTNKVICPSCGEKVAVEMNFCGKCGAAMKTEEEKSETTEDTVEETAETKTEE